MEQLLALYIVLGLIAMVAVDLAWQLFGDWTLRPKYRRRPKNEQTTRRYVAAERWRSR